MADEASQQANRSGMDPKRLMVIFYLAFGIVLALFFGKILEALFGRFAPNVNTASLIEGLDWKVSDILGVVLAAGVVAAGFLQPRLKELSLEVASELMKVTWPTWGETRVATMAVVVASIVSAVVLAGIDYLAFELMVKWLPHLWGTVNG